MKKLGIIILLFMFCSILVSEVFEVKSVNYTGFQQDVTTIFYVNVYVDSFTTATNCRLWIDVDESSSWNTPYFSNGITNYHEFTVSPSDNGTIIVENILIVPNTTRTIEKLEIKASIGYQAILPEEQSYDLKVVIDVPFDTNFLNENQQQEMAEKFLPVMRLDDGTQIEEQYPLTSVGPELFIPKQIEILADSCEIWIRRGINQSIINPSASKAEIANYCQESNFLEFIAGDEPQPIVDWNTAHQSNYNTQIYASFCEEDDYIILSYWFFYLFNNNIGWGDLGTTTDQHLGEWEGMNILFNKVEVQANGIDAIPFAAATSSHTIGDLGTRRFWWEIERIDNHPIIYVANGSHPTFFHRGHSINQMLIDRDYHYGDGIWIVPQGEYGISDSEIDALCDNNPYYNYSQIVNYGDGGTSSNYVEIIPRLNSINVTQLQDYWHLFGGAWGQSKTGTARDRAELTSPSSPPFVASIWAGFPFTIHNDGYKWFKPYTWYLDQNRVFNSIGVSFFAYPSSIVAGEVVTYSSNTLGNPTSLLWDFGDGNTSTEENPTHIYLEPGNYSVTVTISDGINIVTVVKTDLITVISAPAPNPIISVTPTSLTETLQEDQTSQQTIYISNTGNAVLTCTINVDADWLSISSNYSSILAGENEYIEVTFDASSLAVGSYESYIEVGSNDSNTPLINIPVTLNVIDDEPNNSFLTSIPIEVGMYYQQHQINPSGDVDYFQYEVVQGYGYTVLLENEQGCNVRFNLYNHEENSFASSETSDYNYLSPHTGTNYIKVYRYNGQGIGSYTIRVIPAYWNGDAQPSWDEYFEPNVSSFNSYLVSTTGTEYYGEIENQTDNDYYRFTAIQGNVYSISLLEEHSVNVRFNLYFIDANHNLSTIESSETTSFDFNCTKTGAYFIKVYRYNGLSQGNYKIKVDGLSLDYGVKIYPKTAFMQNSSLRNSRMSSYNLFGYSSNSVMLNWSSLDNSIVSVDQNGYVTANSIGQTTIQVSSANNPYEIDEALVIVGPSGLYEPNNSFASSTPIEVEMYHQHHQIDPSGDVDYFQYEVVQGYGYTVLLENEQGCNVRFNLYNHEENSFASSETSDYNYLSPHTGTNYIKVYRYNGQGIGSYTIRVIPAYWNGDAQPSWDEYFEPNVSSFNSYLVSTTGTEYYGEIENQTDNDYYRFTAIQGNVYSISLLEEHSVNVRFNLYFIDANHNLSTIESSETTSFDFNCTKTGAYFIKVYRYNGLSQGNYKIKVDGPPLMIPNIPTNVSIIITSEIISIYWDEVQNATSYKVYSSNNPYFGFLEDETGEFNGTNWNTSVINEKKFYYIVSVNNQFPSNPSQRNKN